MLSSTCTASGLTRQLLFLLSAQILLILYFGYVAANDDAPPGVAANRAQYRIRMRRLGFGIVAGCAFRGENTASVGGVVGLLPVHYDPLTNTLLPQAHSRAVR